MATTLIPVPDRPHQYPALDALLTQAEDLHARTMTGLCNEIVGLLRSGRGLAKSDAGLYVILGGAHADAQDTLSKAISAPHVKKVTVSAPKAPAAKKDGIKKPGSRGALKWYRDDHGNVRYGDKPTPRFHTALSDEEVSSLHRNVWQFFQDASDSAATGSMIYQALKKSAAGITAKDLDTINTVKNYLAEYGGDVATAFEQGMNVEDPDRAINAYTELQGKLNAAVNDPQVEAALKRALKTRKDNDEIAATTLGPRGDLTKDQLPDWLDGQDPDGSTLKLVATGAYNNFFKLVTSRSDVPDYLRDTSWRSLRGRLVADLGIVLALKDYKDGMTPEQLLSVSLAAKMGGDDDLAKEFMELALHDSVQGKSAAEAADIFDKTNGRIAAAKDLLDKWDSNQGGKSLDVIFSDPKAVEDILKGSARGKKALDGMKGADMKHAEIIAAALAARENDKEPEGGYSDKMSKTLKLSKYQNKFINWQLAIKRGINAADTGMGKTPMTIATVDNLIKAGKIKRGVLIMPPALIAQWPKEIEKFRPGSKVVVIDDKLGPSNPPGAKAEARRLLLQSINRGDTPADFVIMSAGVARAVDKEALKKKGMAVDDDGNVTEGGDVDVSDVLEHDPWITELKKLDGAFFYDEAHSASQGLKNPDNISNKVAKHLLKDREYSWLLTATPVPNTPLDLYHLMDLINPGSAGATPEKFMAKIGKWAVDPNTGQEVIVGFHNIKQLNEDIKPYVYAKLKTDPDIAPEMNLPPVVDEAHPLALYPEQQEFYQRAMTELIKAADADAGDEDGEGAANKTMNVLQQINQIRQAAISPALLDPSYKGRSAKFDEVINIVQKKFKDVANRDKPIVVFCSYSKAFPLLQAELEKAGIDKSLMGTIASGVGTTDRSTVQDAANAGKLKVLFVGVQAGGAGLNLQGTTLPDGTHVGPDEMIYLDKPWAPGVLDQSRGRVFRRGQKNTVHVHHLKIAGSYDDKLLEMLSGKVKTSRAILYADQGEDHVQQVSLSALAAFCKEWARSGTTMDADLKQQAAENMKGLLGRDSRSSSADETVANMLGFSLKDPDAEKKRKAFGAMSMPNYLKTQFDRQGFRDAQAERTYLLMGKQRALDHMAVAKEKLRQKKSMGKPYTQADYDTEIAGWKRQLKVWTASDKAGKQLKDSEVPDEATPTTEEGPIRGKARARSNAAFERATQAKNQPKPVLAFHTKKNPYKGKDEDAETVFDLASAKKIHDPDTFMKKYVMPKLLKEVKGKKQLAEATADWLKAVRKVYARFTKDGVLGYASAAPMNADATPPKKGK